ncbi:MAG: ribosome biogenesis GTP-binding protein YihA/YsxC [Bacteroidales bacterium]|jgi:GTP-binding protein|nr:ribosome biogenesis GTP-binding protein YihA/YsxC [Bacteroidales bacterium]MDY0085245.1 ribosome biogenesis GTP-binding protein YihA/YsxC [Bacteroidales bacterium]
MIIQQARFLQSNTKIEKLPDAIYPEYAFIGRSNVGKSSLINMLTGKKKLAKISSKPGKTITINHFLIDESWYLVDLPGYGFAKRSKEAREKWSQMLRQYLWQRTNLIYLFVLVDSRIEPQAIDLDFINELGEAGIPFVIVYTKTDKQSNRKTMSNVKTFEKALSENWEELPKSILSSSLNGSGKEEILSIIASGNTIFNQTDTSTRT